MSDIPNVEDGKYYLVSGSMIKKLAKRASLEGTLDQILVQERDGKWFIGFAEEQEPVAMIVGQTAGLYTVPGVAFKGEGTEEGDDAATRIRKAIGLDDIESFTTRALVVDEATGLMNVESVQVLRRKSIGAST